MGDVFREITYQYLGEDVTIVPSMALLGRVKSKGINTTMLANQVTNGGFDFYDLAKAHSVFMTASGRPMSDEQSLEYLTAGSRDAEILGFMAAYAQAAMPGVDFGKKPEAPARSAPKRKAKSRKT